MDLHYRVKDASQLLEDYFTVKSPLTPEHINTPHRRNRGVLSNDILLPLPMTLAALLAQGDTYNPLRDRPPPSLLLREGGRTVKGAVSRVRVGKGKAG